MSPPAAEDECNPVWEFLLILGHAFRRTFVGDYPLGTPHRREDVEKWPEIAIRNSTVALEVDSAAKAAHARSVAYAFIDRGVSRAQGLLQFNAIIFAVAALFKPTCFYWAIICAFATVAMSTILLLPCLWIKWLAPIAAPTIDTVQEEARQVWRIWLDRALLFNVALVLAGLSFVLVVVAYLFNLS